MPIRIHSLKRFLFRVSFGSILLNSFFLHKIILGKQKKSGGLVKHEIDSSVGILYRQFGNISRDGTVRLAIVTQPEVQHRARYLTEGSRGAIKDREGVGHPAVRLEGYNGAVTIEIYIGNDTGKVVPHLFYQVG